MFPQINQSPLFINQSTQKLINPQSVANYHHKQQVKSALPNAKHQLLNYYFIHQLNFFAQYQQSQFAAFYFFLRSVRITSSVCWTTFLASTKVFYLKKKLTRLSCQKIVCQKWHEARMKQMSL